MNKIEVATEKSMGQLFEELTADFKVVVADAEELVKATANQGGEKLLEVRAKMEESLLVAKVRMAQAQTELLVKSKAAAKATDIYVHENPWEAIGVAAGFGLLIGFLIGRR